ncbi:MAG: hypothetical protein ACI9RM_001417 [Ulvibacter sp.]|jgi:hypothetical protein
MYWLYFGVIVSVFFLFPFNESSHRVLFIDFMIVSLTCKQAKILVLIFLSTIGFLYIKLKAKKINNLLTIVHFVATTSLGFMILSDIDQRYTYAIMSNSNAEINLYDLSIFDQDSLKNKAKRFLNSIKYKTSFLILIQVILLLIVFREKNNAIKNNDLNTLP